MEKTAYSTLLCVYIELSVVGVENAKIHPNFEGFPNLCSLFLSRSSYEFLIEIKIANSSSTYIPSWKCLFSIWETMADSEALSMVDPSIFKSLQNTIDTDSSVREKFKDILQTLDKQGTNT